MNNTLSNPFLVSHDQNFGFTSLLSEDLVITETIDTIDTKYKDFDFNHLRNDIKIIESPLKYSWSFFQKSINKNIQDVIYLGDEEFKIEKEDDMFYLIHPRWSLVGMGNDLMGAITDLLQEAKELFEDLKNVDINSLSIDAFQMRDYLFKII